MTPKFVEVSKFYLIFRRTKYSQLRHLTFWS